MNAITLPRAMVLKLLHLAQRGASSGLIVSLPDGGLGIRPTQAGDSPGSIEGNEAPFAFYRSSAQIRPEAEDIEAWQSVTPLFMSVSVGTKGVLQLRGWRAAGGNIDPVELSLTEEGATQNSGVSRKA